MEVVYYTLYAEHWMVYIFLFCLGRKRMNIFLVSFELKYHKPTLIPNSESKTSTKCTIISPLISSTTLLRP